MAYVKWTILTALALTAAGFLHYTLPQRDIVRIVNTEVRRVDFGGNAMFWAGADAATDGTRTNRDVRFVETIRENGRPIVYRNEDTGWGWPPYFKLDSSNLQAEARDLISSRDAPIWVAVRHYGWRNEILSIFPNAVSVRQVEGPDTRLVPWTNIVILVALASVLALLWGVWRQFRRRRVDPLIDDAGEAWDRVDARLDAGRRRTRRWWSGR